MSTVEAVAASTCKWIFTDGHAVIRLTQCFDQLADLHKVDWKTVHAQRWFNTAEDPDRTRRKQAEFLVHRFFPASLLAGIAVIDPQMAQMVQGILAAAGVTLPVRAWPAWYY